MRSFSIALPPTKDEEGSVYQTVCQCKDVACLKMAKSFGIPDSKSEGYAS